MDRIAQTLLAVGLIVGVQATAEERVRVIVPTPEQEQVRDLLERLAGAISAEDYAAYEACFAEQARDKYCTIEAERFVAADLEMTLGKWLIKKSTPKSTTVVLSYTLAQNGEANSYVSTVECVAGDNCMVIAKESSKPTKMILEDSPPRPESVCPNGICPVRPTRQANAEASQTVSLFNRADGTPDENGPMWLDPRVLFERFPDRYPVCRNCKPTEKDRQSGKGNK